MQGPVQIDPRRKPIQEAIRQICARRPEFTDMDPVLQDALVRRLERSCYAKVINQCKADGTELQFTNKVLMERYSSECYKLLANLDAASSVSNDGFIRRVLSGAVDPLQAGELSSYEMNPENSESMRKEIETRSQQKVERKVSRMYRCAKCGGNETEFYDVQMNCIDEASTIRIQCVKCDHSWKK